MANIVNSGILFYISGIIPGKYIFEQNPSNATILYPQENFNVFQTLEADDIRQMSFIDNEIRVFQWNKSNQSVYRNLKLYSNRDNNGNIPISYLWDQSLKEMQGLPIQVIDVIGTPLKVEYGYYDWQIEMRFNPVQQIDKIYKISILSGGNSSLTGITCNVPDSTYNIQFFDGFMNPLITGANWATYNSSVNQWSIQTSDLPTGVFNSTSYVFSIKNGWVVSKLFVTGVLPGEVFQLV